MTEKKSDITGATGEVYRALRGVFRDLENLAQDFRLALQEHDQEIDDIYQYSYSPNILYLKENHAWSFVRKEVESSNEDDKARQAFAGMYCVFQEKKRRKIGAKWRPEIWFFYVNVIPGTMPKDTPKSLKDFFNHEEKQFFSIQMKLGGAIAVYKNPQSPETESEESWKAVCLGFELGDIDSPETLRTKAVIPLIKAAGDHNLL